MDKNSYAQNAAIRDTSYSNRPVEDYWRCSCGAVLNRIQAGLHIAQNDLNESKHRLIYLSYGPKDDKRSSG